MARQVLNNNDTADVYRSKENANFEELYESKAPNNHASNTQQYGIATGNNYGHIKVTTGNGLNLVDGNLSMNSATSSQAGTVMLQNDLESGSATKAVSSQAVKAEFAKVMTAYAGSGEPSASLGKIGDIYIMI